MGIQRKHKWIYYCLGLGATSPMLAIVYGGRILSLMTLSLVAVFVDLIIKDYQNKTSLRVNIPLVKCYLCWTVIAILSSLFGFVYFIFDNPEYSYRSLSYIPKLCTYLFLFFLLRKDISGRIKIGYIIKGIKFGIMLNLIWCIIDAAMYYSMGESLTNNVFQSYIVASDRPHGMASIIDGLTIRSVGLNVDPATIGFFTIAVTAYAFLVKKMCLVALAIITSMSCVSFVGLVGIIIVVMYHILVTMSTKTMIWSVVLILLLLFISFIFIKNSQNTFIIGVTAAVENRLESKESGDHSSATRELFIKKFPNAVMNMPTSLIIGTGYDSAAYPYYQEGLEYNHGKIPAAIENTYADSYFALGLPGVICFVLLYVRMFIISKKILMKENTDFNRIVYSVAMGSIISFAFYHYTIYSVIMLITILSALYLKENKTYGVNGIANVKD